jgi:hypothetical protein
MGDGRWGGGGVGEFGEFGMGSLGYPLCGFCGIDDLILYCIAKLHVGTLS